MLCELPVLLDEVILDPTDSASFRTDGFAVTSSDPANKSMFCIRDPKDLQQKYVIFQANYYNPYNLKNVYGSFNLGINLPETGHETYLTPVVIDPAVKNNG